jgi:putative transposase
MKEWFASSDLTGLPGMPTTVQGLNRLAKRACWTSRQRQGRGGGVEYSIKSLPADTRHALAKQHTSTAAIAGKVAAATVALKENIGEKAAANARIQSLKNLTKLSSSEHARTFAWLNLIGSFEIFQRACGYAELPAMYAFCTAYNHHEIEVPEEVRAIVSTTSAATLRRKRIELKTQGVTRLAGNYGNRKGQSKIASQKEIEEFVLAMLHEYPHASCEHVKQGLQARFSKRNDVRVPSDRSIQRFIAQWKQENAQLYTAVVNPDKWRNRYMAAAGNASEHIVRLNQVWEADSTPADIILADGKRHAIIGVIDVFTRRLKLQVSRTSKQSAIAALLRRAWLDWGVNEVIKHDNGQDYAGNQLKAIYASMGIEQDVCDPFSPQQKPHIERGLGTFSHALLELCQGFIGHSVAERKDIEARRSFAQRMMRSGETVELRMTAEQLQEFCDQWTETIYHHNEHGGLGKKTPFDIAAAYRGQIHRIDDERALDVLLATPADNATPTITKKGVRIGGGLYNHAALGGLEGNKVRALQDEHDYGFVYLFTIEGEFICKAFDPDRVGISHQEVAAMRKARQKAVISEGKQALKEIAKRVNTRDIANEIIASRAEQISNITMLPQPVAKHTTPELQQAAIAARAGEFQPGEMSDEMTASRQRLIQEFETKQESTVIEIATPASRYERWKRINSYIASNQLVTAEDRRWYEHYKTTSEWTLMDDFYKEFESPEESVGGV